MSDEPNGSIDSADSTATSRDSAASGDRSGTDDRRATDDGDGRRATDDGDERHVDDRGDPDADGWPVVESATEYETGWYDGGYDRVEQPDGTEKRYYWADLPPAVVVVARIDGTAVSAVESGDDGGTGSADEGAFGSADEGAAVSANERAAVSDDERAVEDAEDPTGGGTDVGSADRILFVEQYRPTIGERHLELPAGIVEDGESYTTAAARELEEETGFRPASTVLLQEYAVATGVLRHRRGIVYAEGLVPGERDLDTNEFVAVRSVPVGKALERAREPPANDATVSGLLLATEDGLL